MEENVPVFWKREDLYRWNGKCCYAGECGKYSEKCVPEECPDWEAFYDGEVQGDDMLMDCD